MSAETAIRRSFVGRRLLPAATTTTAQDRARVTLADLSVLPRWGVKGRGSFDWLRREGAACPSGDSRAQRQPDGSLLARLSPAEALILPSLPGGQAALAPAVEALPPEGRADCYPVPRRDSHCWFRLSGDDAPRVFAKLCAVDLAADRFADGMIAQTSVARLSAIVIRHDSVDVIAFFLLADSASAEYLWDCMLDAMTEFTGSEGSRQ